MVIFSCLLKSTSHIEIRNNLQVENYSTQCSNVIAMGGVTFPWVRGHTSVGGDISPGEGNIIFCELTGDKGGMKQRFRHSVDTVCSNPTKINENLRSAERQKVNNNVCNFLLPARRSVSVTTARVQKRLQLPLSSVTTVTNRQPEQRGTDTIRQIQTNHRREKRFNERRDMTRQTQTSPQCGETPETTQTNHHPGDTRLKKAAQTVILLRQDGTQKTHLPTRNKPEKVVPVPIPLHFKDIQTRTTVRLEKPGQHQRQILI